MIEVFILAIYAISYDLVLGVTGLLSFGHAMFFASGGLFYRHRFKTLEWGIPQTLLGLVVVAVVQALLFALVLPRVKGITFALVTLGLASVFSIVIQSSELAEWTGADVGLQGVISPAGLNTNTERFRLYMHHAGWRRCSSLSFTAALSIRRPGASASPFAKTRTGR